MTKTIEYIILFIESERKEMRIEDFNPDLIPLIDWIIKLHGQFFTKCPECGDKIYSSDDIIICNTCNRFICTNCISDNICPDCKKGRLKNE